MAFPSVTLDVVDDFAGADGALDPELWDGSASYYGGSVGIGRTSERMRATTSTGANLGLFEVPANFEATIDVPTATTGNLYLAWFFSLIDGGSSAFKAYSALISEMTWRGRKHIAGDNTAPAENGVGPQLASGDKLGIRKLDGTIEIYHYDADSPGAFNQTPILSFTDSELDGPGTMAFDIQSTAWELDNLKIGELTGGVSGQVSLHVNADHPDADDNRIRSQVTADTPLKTILKAAQLARAVPEDSDGESDEIVVWWAANANPDDPKGDPRVYAGFSHGFGFGYLPFGNNITNKKIVVRGVNAFGETPANEFEVPMWLGVDSTLLAGWRFENMQQGYEDDSGDDVLTIKTLYNPQDIEFDHYRWTGGGYLIRNATGAFTATNFRLSARISEFLGTGGRTLDGVGFKIVNSSETGEDYRCHFTFRDGLVHNVEGEDGFQVGTGAVGQLDTSIMWERVKWKDCVQLGADGSADNPVGIHTDCVQILGGPLYRFLDCEWENCTSCIMASDYRNGRIEVINGKFDGAAISSPGDAGIAMQIQGTDEVLLVNCTGAHSGYGIAFRIFQKYAVPGGTDLWMINNIFDGVQVDAGAAVNRLEPTAPNLIGATYGTFTLGENDIRGFTEFGETEATTLELTTSPASPARNAGITHELVPATDRIGRARVGAPDLGCHESPSSPPILATARPPYVLDPSPVGPGASKTGNFTVRFLPVPGETINAATINPSSVQFTERGKTVPAVRTLGAPDGNGYQVLTIDPKLSVTPTMVEGELFEFGTYQVTLTDAIEDTAGNKIVPAGWQYSPAGPDDAAIRAPGGGGGGPAGWTVGAIA